MALKCRTTEVKLWKREEFQPSKFALAKNKYVAEYVSLQNFHINCLPSEKLVQLTRIVAHDILLYQSSEFIVYFATCACVDYFYRASILYITHYRQQIM